MTNLKKSEWFLLIGLLVITIIPCVTGALRLVEINTSVALLPVNPRIELLPIPAVFHIFSSIIYCIVGAFQLLPSIRRHFLKWHRLAGRLLVVAGIISAVSGLWMTHYYPLPQELQGNLLYFVRIIVGSLMVVYIVLGLSAVLNRKISQHSAWMIRAYALGLGAGMQALVVIPWSLTVGEPSGFTLDILMTLAWGINIAVGEWFISQQRFSSPVAGT